jgi:hypothetical protein
VCYNAAHGSKEKIKYSQFNRNEAFSFTYKFQRGGEENRREALTICDESKDQIHKEPKKPETRKNV